MEFETLSEEDLLDLVLLGRIRQGGGVGRRLLDRFGGLRGLGRAGRAELMELAGIGEIRSQKVRALICLARRFAKEPLRLGRKVGSTRDIFRHFHPGLRDLKKERFVTLLLDGKNRIIGERIISEGSLNASLVHPREVFSPAIRESAGAIVLVHNHPSGDPTPSLEDIEVTRRLVEVGDLVGIRVLDHVIVGEEGYTSFVDRGLLERGSRFCEPCATRRRGAR